jgi:hypothetical protein
MATYFWVGGSGTWNGSSTTNWAATSGGAGGAGVPNNTDTVNFDANSGTGTVSVAATAVSLNTTVNSANITLLLTDSPTLCTSAGLLTLTAGAISLNTFTLTCGRFSSSNANVRSIAFGTGNITLTGNASTVWVGGTVTNFSYTGTPTVNLTYAGATGTRTISTNITGGTETRVLDFNISAGTDIISIASGSQVRNLNFTGFSGTFSNVSLVIYGNLTNSATMILGGGTASVIFRATSGVQQITNNGLTLDFPLIFNGIGSTMAFQDALTQSSTRAFTITNGTVQFKNGVTSTVGVFTTSGANQKFLQSVTLGSQATLSQASGTVNANNLTVRDINATGGATWNAFVDQGNVDAGNVDGWNFGISPVVGGTEYTYRIRSFTQPGKF